MNPDFSRTAAGVLNGPYFDYERYEGPTGTPEEVKKAVAWSNELDAERNLLIEALHSPKCEDYSSLSDEAKKVYDKAYDMWYWAGRCRPRPGETPEEYDLRDRMEGPVFFSAKDADEDEDETGESSFEHGKEEKEKQPKPSEFDKLASKNYLGDIKVVSGLLKDFVNAFLIREFRDGEEAAEYFADSPTTDVLSEILLGKDKNFPGPPWFSPGQIDVHVANLCGYINEEPEQRIAFALIDLAEGLRRLAEQKDPKWQEKSTEILTRYTYIFMGTPFELCSEIKAKKGCAPPTGEGDVLDVGDPVKNGDVVYIEQVEPQKFVIRILLPVDAAGFTGSKYIVARDANDGGFELVELAD